MTGEDGGLIYKWGQESMAVAGANLVRVQFIVCFFPSFVFFSLLGCKVLYSSIPSRLEP